MCRVYPLLFHHQQCGRAKCIPFHLQLGGRVVFIPLQFEQCTCSWCIPVHRLQCGHAGCILLHLKQHVSAGCIHLYHHQSGCEGEGVSLSAVNSVDMSMNSFPAVSACRVYLSCPPSVCNVACRVYRSLLSAIWTWCPFPLQPLPSDFP
jgi:hypothetical protein